MRNSWLLAFLVLPWLTPYTAGPTPNVWPLLLSALCAAVVWFYRRQLNVRLLIVGWLLAAAVSALIALVQYFGLAQAPNMPTISLCLGVLTCWLY